MDYFLSNALIWNILLAGEYRPITDYNNRGRMLGEETERTSTKRSILISIVFNLFSYKMNSIQGSEFLFNGRWLY